jgi:hypothetical protein
MKVLPADPPDMPTIGVHIDELTGRITAVPSWTDPLTGTNYKLELPEAKELPAECPCGIFRLDCEYHR